MPYCRHTVQERDSKGMFSDLSGQRCWCPLALGGRSGEEPRGPAALGLLPPIHPRPVASPCSRAHFSRRWAVGAKMRIKLCWETRRSPRVLSSTDATFPGGKPAIFREKACGTDVTFTLRVRCRSSSFSLHKWRSTGTTEDPN